MNARRIASVSAIHSVLYDAVDAATLEYGIGKVDGTAACSVALTALDRAADSITRRVGAVDSTEEAVFACLNCI